MTVDSSIHYSRSYCNAFWDGNRCVFGDGDGLVFKDFTSSNDFVAHEVMHGVTQYTVDLDYELEAGALNESMSDVFGVAFRQWVAKDIAMADWSIGADMIGPTALQLGWTCLRHVRNPDAPYSMTKQPIRYSEYDPNGEPHINSGIPNRAFSLVASALQRPSWQGAVQIWYRALASPGAFASMGFSKFAELTLRSAADAQPSIPGAVEAVRTAWDSVGVTPTT